MPSTPDPLLVAVKQALNVTGDYQNDCLTQFINEVKSFLVDAGVKAENITSGIVTRGVADLWNYGSADGKLSEYFIMRASQLSYK